MIIMTYLAVVVELVRVDLGSEVVEWERAKGNNSPRILCISFITPVR